MTDYEFSEAEEIAADRSARLFALGFSAAQIIQINPTFHPDIVHKAEEFLAAGKTHEQVAWLLEEVRP